MPGKAKTKACLHCKATYNHRNPMLTTTCTVDCHYGYLRQQSLEKFKDGIEGVDYIECKICGQKAADLKSHITNFHKIKTEDYRSQYNVDSLISEKLRKGYSDKVSGDKNPAYNHGGRFSPFSEKFVKYQDGSSDYTIDDIKKKAVDSIRDNPQNRPTRVEYWIERGHTEDEATRLVSERQSTFNLEKCIEKYGEEAGYNRWIERQDKWQDTLNSKPQEEIDEINRRKATRINYATLWGMEISTEPGGFYVIEINPTLVKIGITSKSSLSQRYRVGIDKKYRTTFYKMETMECAFMVEQVLKNKLADAKICKEEAVMPFGWTETFKVDYDTVVSQFGGLLCEDKYREEFERLYPNENIGNS